ncbi:acyl-CoA dehydrogenase family protein [Mycobacterium vicinigordonae]|uniref:Acyl-CoA dehydrogenase family protein n=1 Tax=Mycobacterium vicinigordonae TaxID=1719132 RepID=A0A7D6I8W5_9MYCO|nr:acyl-CoA dehydrogenase family protein [Mycobacterium vicinigordonae]QLL07537.1 acyl-CoA dehydrogenase family protein [Mycobacterium vicinigordonae]
MSLIDEAQRIAPELAAAEDEAAELRQLPDNVWKQLQDIGFLRALQPARFGGGEVSLREFVDCVIEVSKASPSAGWVTGVIGVHPWQLALFPDQAQQEMWGDEPARMHSSSYNPTGTAQRVNGGYQVSGRWSFSSGCDHCEGVNVGAILRGPEGSEYRSFLLHADQYRIEDNWHVAGLRGTGSKDIVVAETFVPEHRSQSHLDYAFGKPLPGQQVNPGPLYLLPWSVVFNIALAASVLGSATGFVQRWTQESSTRVIPPGLAQADDPLTQRRLAEATWTLDAALAMLHTDVDTLWQMALDGVIATMEQRGRFRWNLNRSCELVAAAIGDLMRAASGRSVFLNHPLQRRFQDIQAAMGHAYLVADPLAKSVGGSLMGTKTPEMVL